MSANNAVKLVALAAVWAIAAAVRPLLIRRCRRSPPRGLPHRRWTNNSSPTSRAPGYGPPTCPRPVARTNSTSAGIWAQLRMRGCHNQLRTLRTGVRNGRHNLRHRPLLRPAIGIDLFANCVTKMKQGVGVVTRDRSAVVGQHVEEPILIGMCPPSVPACVSVSESSPRATTRPPATRLSEPSRPVLGPTRTGAQAALDGRDALGGNQVYPRSVRSLLLLVFAGS